MSQTKKYKGSRRKRRGSIRKRRGGGIFNFFKRDKPLKLSPPNNIPKSKLYSCNDESIRAIDIAFEFLYDDEKYDDSTRIAYKRQLRIWYPMINDFFETFLIKALEFDEYEHCKEYLLECLEYLKIIMKIESYPGYKILKNIRPFPTKEVENYINKIRREFNNELLYYRYSVNDTTANEFKKVFYNLHPHNENMNFERLYRFPARRDINFNLSSNPTENMFKNTNNFESPSNNQNAPLNLPVISKPKYTYTPRIFTETIFSADAKPGNKGQTTIHYID